MMRGVICLAGWLLSGSAALAGDKIAANVDAALKRGERATVLVSLAQQADLKSIVDKRRGDDRLVASVARLRETAARTQAPLRAFLDARKVSYQAFWVANFIALKADADLVAALAARADVAAIELDSRLSGERPVEEFPAGLKAITAIEPGVTRVNAPSLWAMGFRGQNVTGVGIDQVEEISSKQYNNVLGRVRVTDELDLAAPDVGPECAQEPMEVHGDETTRRVAGSRRAPWRRAAPGQLPSHRGGRPSWTSNPRCR